MLRLRGYAACIDTGPMALLSAVELLATRADRPASFRRGGRQDVRHQYRTAVGRQPVNRRTAAAASPQP